MPSEAQRIYSQIIQDSKAEDSEILCAKRGLHAVAQYYIGQGDNFRSRGELAAAKEAYSAALKIDTDYMEAQEKLTQLQQDELGSTLKALIELGLEEDALRTFKEAIAKDPTASRSIELSAT